MSERKCIATKNVHGFHLRHRCAKDMHSSCAGHIDMDPADCGIHLPVYAEPEAGGATEGLKDCPFCGVTLVQRGDYADTDAWNWFSHPEKDDGEPNDCIIGDLRLDVVLASGQILDAPKWNRRAHQPAPQPEQGRERAAAHMELDVFIDLCATWPCENHKTTWPELSRFAAKSSNEDDPCVGCAYVEALRYIEELGVAIFDGEPVGDPIARLREQREGAERESKLAYETIADLRAVVSAAERALFAFDHSDDADLVVFDRMDDLRAALAKVKESK